MLNPSLMTLELPSLSLSSFIWFLVVLNVILFLYIQAISKGKYSNAPLVQGSSGLLGHWCGGLSFVFGAAKVIDLGYQQHDIYQVKTPGDYCIMTSNSKYIKEMTDAPESVLSMSEKLRDEMQSDHTIPGLFDDGKVAEREQYHLRFLKTFLVNRLSQVFPMFAKESIYQFEELLKEAENKEYSISAYHISRKVLASANNRWLVGPKLCRDSKYIDVMVDFAINAILSGYIIRFLPNFLKGIVVRYIRRDHKRRKTAEDQVIMLINERRSMAAEGSKKKADDALQVLMDNPPTFQTWTPRDISQSILTLNIGAVNLTVQAFTHCIFDIAEQKKFLPAIREEIRGALKQEGGWTKAAVDKMALLESFIKESQRIHPHRIATCARKAQQDFTFSNGITVPKGTEVAVPLLSLAMDDSNFASAREFNGLRFYSKDQDVPINRLSSSSCSPPLLGFGYGRHVCPGKAWAALELKILCAYLIHHYDLRLQDESKRPKSMDFFVLTTANMEEKVRFKRRAAEFYDVKE